MSGLGPTRLSYNSKTVISDTKAMDHFAKGEPVIVECGKDAFDVEVWFGEVEKPKKVVAADAPKKKASTATE